MAKSKKSDPKRSGNPAKAAAAEKESRAAANRVSRVPVKVRRTGSPNWYAPSMVTLMVIGLLWVVVTYLFKGQYPLPYFTKSHAGDWLSHYDARFPGAPALEVRSREGRGPSLVASYICR